MLKRLKSNTKNWVLSNRKKFNVNKSLTMCKKCYTFYYENSWHFYRPLNMKIGNDEEVSVRFTECSTCLDQESALFDTDLNLAW